MTLTLLDLLSNTLVLSHISPHLPVSCLASLAASSKLFYSLVYDTPYVFRRLDLSTVKAAGTLFDQIDTGGVKWRNQQMDEAITEEDFYSGPLRGIFGKLKRKNVLQDVRTLILDGLSVPAELVHEIIADDPFNVEILSIRGAKNINEGKLAQTLLYAARPSRPPNTPRLKGFYFFGSDPRPQAPATDSQVEPSQTSSTASMDSVTTGLGAQIGQ
ncbi:MAG: hypothetical protein M1833_003959 [Piccolia ochrophora]|nr:MAG: hypothetical protein M1833_003959 [Piccolia ochrophora]